MAPTPATTNLFYVDYAGAMGTRTFQVRFGDFADLGTVALEVDAWLRNDVAPVWSNTVAVTGYRYRQIGTTFSLPYPLASPITGSAAGTLAATDYPRYLSLSGRGVGTGSEVRLFIYGLIFVTPADYRAEAGEFPALDNLRTGWAAMVPAAGLVTDGNDTFTPRLYANVGYNSYYQRKRRAEA